MDDTVAKLDSTGTHGNQAVTGKSAAFITRDHLIGSEADVQEQLFRLQADFANFRRRTRNVAEQAADHRAVEIVTLLLPVIDNLERAMRTETADQPYAEGVQLTYRQFMSVLVSLGLEVIPAAGLVFDPHVHEAVTTVPTDHVPEGTVLEEIRKGYRLNGTLLRPAQVSVTMASRERAGL